MVDSKYSRAYTEVLEIIKYFPKKEYEKIPIEKIKFYQNNKDNNYIFKIDPQIDLSEQNISKQANAIIINLFTEYFATEEQNIKIKRILTLNQEKQEQEKRQKYNPDNIFEKRKEVINNKINKESNALVEYKESFFTKFKKYLFKILHIHT